MSRRSWFAALAALLVIVLVGGRWLALETAERAWAASFPGGAVLIEARTLGHLMRAFVVVFAVTWATGNLFVVFRTIGSVQMPRRLGDLEIVEAVPQPVLFGLTLGTGIVAGLLLTLGTGDWWRSALLAWGPPHFGITDEVLKHDLGYYVAVLPWQSTLQAHATTWTVGATIVIGSLYAAIGSLRMHHGRLHTSDHARAHLAVLLACVALVLAWGAALDPEEIVGGVKGIVDQTALDVRIPAAQFVTAVGVATALASLLWGWRDRPNLVLGGWAAFFLAMASCYVIIPGLVRASRTSDETALLRRRAAMERLAFGLASAQPHSPPGLRAVRPRDLPLWDPGRVEMVLGSKAAVTLSAAPSGWLAVPLPPGAGAPRIAVETDTGLALVRAPIRAADTSAWFAPGAGSFAVASPDAPPALRATGITLQGSWRRAALAWALQGTQLARAETDGRALLWRRDIVERLGRLAPFATFGEPTPALADSALWWLSWGYVSSASFAFARALPWRGEPVRYLRAGLVGAVRAATGETHIWLAPGYDSLTAAWAQHFETLIEPSQRMPAALRSRLAYPPEVFDLAMRQVARANRGEGSDSTVWSPRPREPFQLAQDGDLWTAVAFEAKGGADTQPRFAALLAGTVSSLYLWRPGPLQRLPTELVGSTETSPGQLRIWLAGDSIVTLQAQFAQTNAEPPRGVAEVFLTLGDRAGRGQTEAEAFRALLTGERGRMPLDTTLVARWEQARRLIARADSALNARNLERFGQVWQEIRRLLAPAPRPR